MKPSDCLQQRFLVSTSERIDAEDRQSLEKDLFTTGLLPAEWKLVIWTLTWFKNTDNFFDKGRQQKAELSVWTKIFSTQQLSLDVQQLSFECQKEKELSNI